MRDRASGVSGSPRLLFVVNDAAFFLSHRLPLAVAARDDGWDVHVATPPDTGEAQVIAQGFSFHPVPLTRKGGNPWRELQALLALYRLYRHLQPDLVHHVTIKPVLYGGIAARLARVPAVVSAVSGLGYAFIAEGLRARWLRRGLLMAYRLALGHPKVRVIFQNPDDQAFFLTQRLVRKGRCVLIRGAGVDLDEFSPVAEPEGEPLVVLPARMLRDKGVQEFVDAANLLRVQGVAARFALVGDSDEGNPAAIPQTQLEAWHRAGVVEWWGRRTDMPQVFGMSHIVCLPSYREGLPKALLEAAACGRPIITTDVPGCREAVIDGENGFIVPVRDPVRLAEAMRSLIGNADLRRKMGAAGRVLAVDEFSIAHVVSRTLAVYHALLEEE